jgi:hypothetical protein
VSLGVLAYLAARHESHDLSVEVHVVEVAVNPRIDGITGDLGPIAPPTTFASVVPASTPVDGAGASGAHAATASARATISGRRVRRNWRALMRVTYALAVGTAWGRIC